MCASISLIPLSHLCNIAIASLPSERGWWGPDLVGLESSCFLAVQLVVAFLPFLYSVPTITRGWLYGPNLEVCRTISAVVLSFLWYMKLHLSCWVLLGIHSEMLMDNLRAVSPAGSGSSHDFLPGLTLHLDFMMCLKKRVNCFWGNHYWYLFHQNTYLGTAPLSVEGGSEVSSVSTACAG